MLAHPKTAMVRKVRKHFVYDEVSDVTIIFNDENGFVHRGLVG